MGQDIQGSTMTHVHDFKQYILGDIVYYQCDCIAESITAFATKLVPSISKRLGGRKAGNPAPVEEI